MEDSAGSGRPRPPPADVGAVADSGGVADPEQAAELERVAAAGLGFGQEPVSAQVLCGDIQPVHGGVDVVAADRFEAAAGAPVDQQVLVGGGRPAGVPGL
jgi:hypothetical protein